MPEPLNKSARSIGILMHPTSLPNSSFCGSFGAPARNWLKLLFECGINIWQFLPLSPPDSTGSPYSSPSSFAFNPWFLDAYDLIEDNFVSEFIIDETFLQSVKAKSFLDFQSAELWSQKLGIYLREGWSKQSSKTHQEFELWSSKQFWLEDHACFMQLRRQFNQKPWWEWPEEYALYDKNKLKKWKLNNKDNLLEHRLIQWHLDRQWQRIRNLSKQLDIKLVGDLPFYVSRDSADVWSNRSLFSVLSNGQLYLQSGVPPDYFSDTGQLWGTPVYRWKRHKLSHYRWWRSRFQRNWQQVDLLRLDHFRALNSYWAIPGDHKTAQNGYWLPSPGKDLLYLVKRDKYGELPLIAEDLGIITPEVSYLRDHFKLPGMKILQFAFDGDENNPYLPKNINGENWIVYTGTHDNSTTNGWWKDLGEATKKLVNENCKQNGSSPNWMLIEMGMSTKAKIFIAPIQDIIGLDDLCRFNTPGTTEENWVWRLDSFNENVVNSLKEYGDLAKSYDRNLH